MLATDGVLPDCGDAAPGVGAEPMHSASDQPSSEQRRFALPRRTTSIIITLIVHVLLMLMLITLSQPRIFVPMAKNGLISISIASDQKKANSAKSQTKAKTTSKREKPAAAAPASQPVPPPIPNQSAPDYPVIKLTHDEMAGLDATLRNHSSNAGESASTNAPGDSAEAGTGPHGEQLYAAEWYREPTDAELSFYMPSNKTGWGDVGCRTVARFHVEDCVELGESPRGSGFSRAVREAAWQFLVRPPRVGGKLMVGEWVRIRISITERPADK
jgi:protein TonB